MDAKLNQSDLIALLAKESNISAAKAELFTKNFFELIIEGLEQDGIVKINGLGTFKVTEVASRGSVNVNTGEKIEIKGHKKLVFIPADALKDYVNQPFAMFEPVEVDETYQPEATAVDAENDEAAEEIESPMVASEPVVEETAEETPATEEISVEKPVASEPENASGCDAVENRGVDCGTTSQNEGATVTETVAEPIVVQKRPAEPVLVRVPKKNKPMHEPVAKKKKNRVWIYTMIAALVVLVIYINNTKTTTVESAIESNATVNTVSTNSIAQTSGSNTTTTPLMVELPVNNELKDTMGIVTPVAVEVVEPVDTVPAVMAVQDSTMVAVVEETVVAEIPAEANGNVRVPVAVTSLFGFLATDDSVKIAETILEPVAEPIVEELVATDDSVKISETILEPVAESVADNDSVKIMGTIQELVAETVVEEYVKSAETALAVQDSVAVAVVEMAVIAEKPVDVVEIAQETAVAPIDVEVVATEPAQVAETAQETVAETVVEEIVEPVVAVQTVQDSVVASVVEEIVVAEQPVDAVEATEAPVTETVVEEVIVAEKPVDAVEAVEVPVSETVVEEVIVAEKAVVAVEATEAPVTETVVEEVPAKNEPYKFVMVQELQSINQKNITVADTTLYVVEGELTVHRVVLDDRLAKIAKKYYGDKRLWPYIAKYNELKKPNALQKGMKIRIPRLVPKK